MSKSLDLKHCTFARRQHGSRWCHYNVVSCNHGNTRRSPGGGRGRKLWYDKLRYPTHSRKKKKKTAGISQLKGNHSERKPAVGAIFYLTNKIYSVADKPPRRQSAERLFLMGCPSRASERLNVVHRGTGTRQRLLAIRTFSPQPSFPLPFPPSFLSMYVFQTRMEITLYRPLPFHLTLLHPSSYPLLYPLYSKVEGCSLVQLPVISKETPKLRARDWEKDRPTVATDKVFTPLPESDRE